jgi:hypothetical protein
MTVTINRLITILSYRFAASQHRHNILILLIVNIILKLRYKYETNLLYKTIILLADFYGCETWFFTLREQPRIKVFENRVLRKMYEPKIWEVDGDAEDCIMRSFITCTLHTK